MIQIINIFTDTMGDTRLFLFNELIILTHKMNHRPKSNLALIIQKNILLLITEISRNNMSLHGESKLKLYFIGLFLLHFYYRITTHQKSLSISDLMGKMLYESEMRYKDYIKLQQVCSLL